MVPSSNWTGSKPLKLEIGVRVSVESPLGKECYLAKQLHSNGANIAVGNTRQESGFFSAEDCPSV